MKKWFAALAVLTSCLPSTGEYARGTPDGGPEAGPPATLITLEGGTSEAGSAEAGVDAGPLPKSCKDAKAAAPATTDGFVTTTHGDVYCNMSIDGGGWTMVGRSHDEQDGADKDVPFGWTGSTGNARDGNHPYSLGVLGLDFDFTQVLVAKVDDTGTMALGQTYEIQLTKSELAANGNTNFAVDSVTTAKGNCKPSGGPSMLSRAGYTSTANHFHFRDVGGEIDSATQEFGLIWHGLETNYTDCNQGGNLEAQGGAIFVR